MVPRGTFGWIRWRPSGPGTRTFSWFFSNLPTWKFTETAENGKPGKEAVPEPPGSGPVRQSEVHESTARRARGPRPRISGGATYLFDLPSEREYRSALLFWSIPFESSSMIHAYRRGSRLLQPLDLSSVARRYASARLGSGARPRERASPLPPRLQLELHLLGQGKPGKDEASPRRSRFNLRRSRRSRRLFLRIFARSVSRDINSILRLRDRPTTTVLGQPVRYE